MDGPSVGLCRRTPSLGALLERWQKRRSVKGQSGSGAVERGLSRGPSLSRLNGPKRVVGVALVGGAKRVTTPPSVKAVWTLRCGPRLDMPKPRWSENTGAKASLGDGAVGAACGAPQKGRGRAGVSRAKPQDRQAARRGKAAIGVSIDQVCIEGVGKLGRKSLPKPLT